MHPGKDIDLYINSPGGSVTAGLAIYDTIQSISCDGKTYCIGQCASMGAVLLASGIQYLGHLMQRTDSLEKTLMLENIEEGRMRWLDGITNLKDMSLRSWW